MRKRARIHAAARVLAGRLAPPSSVSLAVLPLLAASPLARGGGDPLEIGLVIGFLILSLALHEVAHGFTALLCGDPTARDLGRLSLNPIVHIDLVWTIIMPLVTYMSAGLIFGGAKPVPVDFRRLRHPLRDMSLVAAAGPLTNLVLAVVFLVSWKWVVYHQGLGDNTLVARVLLGSAQFNVLLFVFNLIPIPPLDGSRIMTWLLPAGLREGYAGLERFGMILIVGLLFFVPPFQAFFRSGMDALLAIYVNTATGDLVPRGFLDTLTGGIW